MASRQVRLKRSVMFFPDGGFHVPKTLAVGQQVSALIEYGSDGTQAKACYWDCLTSQGFFAYITNADVKRWPFKATS